MKKSSHLPSPLPKNYIQLYNWDCGLACLIMALDVPESSHSGLYSYFAPCKEMVYTIDLYDFLVSLPFSKAPLFTTTELGLST
jgi:hypothetical protein